MNVLFIMLEILFMVTTVRSRRAFLEIILYEMNENDGRYTMHKIGITGEFSNAGTAGAAEGDIIQMHPHSLCDDDGNGDKYDYGWVGVVKLSYHGPEPCHLVEKARKAVGQGATAVVFDVSDHPDALRQLDENSYSILNQPIVLVKGMDATELMKVINGEQIARAVIKRGQPDQDSVEGKFKDPALLMTGILVMFVVLAVVISKVKCRKRQQEASLHNWTVQHSKTKKHRKNGQFYHAVPQESKGWKKSCGTSDCSSAMLCAICLDSFQDGEDLRVLECLHEFHIKCIDAWLKQKRACPLCNRSFSNLTANAQSSQQDAAANILNATDNLSSAWHQSEMQLVHASLIDGSQNSTTYGSTLQRSENDTHHDRSFISDTTNQSSRTINDSVTSDYDHNNESDTDGLCRETCHECNSCNTSWNGGNSDHKDSVMISHRKRNQNRGLSCRSTKHELTKSTIEFSSAERTKLRAEHYATHNYLHRKGNEAMKDENAYADGMCDENCVCRINGASDTSMLALRGSPPFFETDPDFLSSSSSFFDTSKFVEYSSNQPRVDTSEYCNQLPRCPTPCIEYSSSDGASHLGWISYSTLEDVLGAIDSSHSGFSS